MIGEEAASEAEEGEETGVAGASEVTDAAGEVDLAGVGTGVEGAPWEEAGEVEIGTGLTKQLNTDKQIMRGIADQKVDIYSDYVLVIEWTIRESN